MAAGFSVKDALNRNSKAGLDETPRARFRTKDISIHKMYRNEMNFYTVEQIEELAGDILMYGLKQNLELVYAPCEKGEYRIVAGERRWEALKYLVSKGYKEFELATSKLTTPQDDDEEQIEIIIANAYRAKTVADMLEEETKLKESLENMKAAGKKIKGYDLQSGRLRDVIASMLSLSKTKIAQIEAINNNLIQECKDEIRTERLTFSAAYELSGLSEQDQHKALEKLEETGKLTHRDVKDIKEGKTKLQEESVLVSESDTDYQNPNPVNATSVCYSCTEYEHCNRKTSTCITCDSYKNRAEAHKTHEQKYDEEQARLDKQTNAGLREIEQQQKMEHLPSEKVDAKYMRVSHQKFERLSHEAQLYIIEKNEGYKTGQVITFMEFKEGRATGREIKRRITYMDDANTSSAIKEGYCVMNIK